MLRAELMVLVAVAALLVAADTAHVTHAYRNAANVSRVEAKAQQQVLISSRRGDPYLPLIAKGERIRESKVVQEAAKRTLERAKREAAAAVAGEWQPWMSGSSAGVVVPPGTGGYVLPTKGLFTSGFGARWGTFHAGIDVAGPIGTPIYAVAAGTVIDAGPASGFGLWVRIRHDDGTVTVYGHLHDFFVSRGERVPAGMQIARMGNRGDSTGPHLHFEVLLGGRHVDPQRWLALHGLKLG